MFADLHVKERQQIVDAVGLLFQAGVMSHSGHANFSCRLAGDPVLITTGTLVRDLHPDAAEAELAAAALGGGCDFPQTAGTLGSPGGQPSSSGTEA